MFNLNLKSMVFYKNPSTTTIFVGNKVIDQKFEYQVILGRLTG